MPMPIETGTFFWKFEIQFLVIFPSYQNLSLTYQSVVVSILVTIPVFQSTAVLHCHTSFPPSWTNNGNYRI